MKEIIFVTSNKGKIATAQKDLKNIKVLSLGLGKKTLLSMMKVKKIHV